MSCSAESSVADDKKNRVNNNFKIVLVGDGGTGKSSYVDRLNDGGFRKEYIATLGIEKHDILVETTNGSFNINIYDTSGQEKFGPLRDDYYKGVNGAILFFDVTSRVTYKNIPQWHKDITRVCPDIPIALCANKIDVNPTVRKVKTKNIIYHQKYPNQISLFEISVKEQKCLKEPIEYILQKIVNDNSLKINGSLGTLIFNELDNLSL